MNVKDGKGSSGLEESAFDLAPSEWRRVSALEKMSASPVRGVKTKKLIRRRVGEKWPAAMTLPVI